MTPQVTMVCANLGMSSAFQLMWESFCKYHKRGEVVLYVLNQPVQDGLTIIDDATEYSERVADRCFKPDTMICHGAALDLLCSEVETPYTLIVDNDIEFVAPVLSGMLEAMEQNGTFGVCAPCIGLGTTSLYGVETAGQERIEPWCALIVTRQVKRVLKQFSWSSYASRDLGQHWDVGGMFLKGMRLLGLDVSRLSGIFLKVHHFGCVSWGAYAPEGSPIRAIAEGRYAEIKGRLALLRAIHDGPVIRG